MRNRDELKKVLAIASHGTISVDDFADANTTDEVMHVFVEKSNTKVIFSVTSSTYINDDLVISIGGVLGDLVLDSTDTTCGLPVGDYTYTASSTGAVTITNEPFTVTEADVLSGSKFIIINFEAAE